MRQTLIQSRKRKGFTPEDVAKKIGVTPRMYRYYESGERTPSLKAANALEDLFKTPQRKLLEVIKQAS